jgi:hypothetical protein
MQPHTFTDMKSYIFRLLGISLVTLAFASQASAIPYSVTPLSATVATGTDNNQPSIAEIEAASGFSPLTIAYKAEVGISGDAGTYASSYSTTFSGTPSNPSAADIIYGGIGPVISMDPLFLLVKDGNHAPYWYLFDISSWNGTDTLSLSGFWPDQGCISNIVIYTGNQTTVPETATTMILLGAGLLGLLLVKRTTLRVA